MIKKISEIKPDPNQPRKTFDEEELKLLAESILSNGLLDPVEIDQYNIITDGERRYRAHKLAGLKTIDCTIVSVKDKKAKKRRQMVKIVQTKGIKMEEKYPAIVELWKDHKTANTAVGSPNSKEGEKFCKELGISVRGLRTACDYCNYIEKEPEIAKKVSPTIIMQTANLPEKERKEVLKEFEGSKDKKVSLIQELVKEKRKDVQTKKQLEELRKKNVELKEAKKWEVKVTTTQDVLNDIKNGIIQTHNELSGLMSRIRRIRKTKFYLYKPKDKDNFIRFLEGASDKARKWADELDSLKENISLEIVKE